MLRCLVRSVNVEESDEATNDLPKQKARNTLTTANKFLTHRCFTAILPPRNGKSRGQSPE